MPIDLFRGLNERQAEAIKINQNPLLILAGAGSGKTKVLTHKIAYLILQEKYPAYSILAMTFTNKAATEMKQRIAQMLGSSVDSLWIGTFHSLFARILRKHAQLLGFTSAFTIFDRDDSLNVIKAILKQLPDGKNINPRSILSQVSNAKNAILNPEEAAKVEHFDPLFIKAYGLYEKELYKSNAMDFDDLLIKPLALFEEHSEILSRYRQNFRFILIDEYQDTNIVQFKLAKILAEEHQRICVVGDEDQSIYGWRGANIGNILTFSDTFPAAKTVRLEQNYRSFSAILEVANSVVKKNKNRLGKDLFTKKGEGVKPIVWETQTGQKEAAKVFSIVSDLIKNENYKLGEIAVLYRTNAHSRLLEEIMRNQGISYEIVGGTKFYDRMEIKDALAYLRLIANPKDTQAFQRVVAVPKRGVGSKTLEQIYYESSRTDSSLFESLTKMVSEKQFSPKVQENLEKLIKILNESKSHNGNIKTATLVEQLIQQSGLIDHYEMVDEKERAKFFTQPESFNSRADNLYDLVDTVNEFSKRMDNENISLEEFLQDVQLQTDIDEWNDSLQKLTLMTIHQAKGLEFPAVIISGLEQGLLPLSHNFDEPEDLEEERRLFYVAATRAEDRLYMTYARRRFRHGDELFCLPSQFIDEIREDLIVKKSDIGDISGQRQRIREKINRHDDEPYYDYSDNQIDKTDQLSIGMEVNHPTFGDGKIINIEGFGGNTKITVLFYDGYFSKKLLKRYANLQVIDS